MKVPFHSSVLTLVVFFAWTLTSFICHYCAKQALLSATEIWGLEYAFVHAACIACAQMTMCYLTVKIPILSNPNGNNGRFFTIATSHALSTYLTIYSMAIIHADSTFAIKLIEPISTAILSSALTDATVSLITWLSLPLIIIGACGFAGIFVHDITIGLGTTYALLSNTSYGVRNIAIKYTFKTKVIAFHSYKRLICVMLLFATLMMICLLYRSLFHFDIFVMCMYVTCSAVFHVIYSYLSTAVVLQYLSVVSHAVANILKRLSVVLLLYTLGKRITTWFNISCLFICVIGLALYIYDKVKAISVVNKTSTVGHGEEKKPSQDLSARSEKRLKWIILLILVTSIFLISGGIPLFHGQTCILSPYSNDKLCQPNVLSTNVSATPLQRDVVTLQQKYEQNSTAWRLRRNMSLEEFRGWRLIEHPNDTNRIAPLLTKNAELITEIKRVLLQVFGDLLHEHTHVMLFDMANFENKGDPGINYGELRLLRDLKLDVVFNCNFRNCTDANLAKAKVMSANFSVTKLAILCSGGGNLGGYPANDYLRNKIITQYAKHKIVIFPQSTWFHSEQHLTFAQKMYNKHNDLTICLRDRVSYLYATKHFTKAKTILMPDIAFYIGPVSRFMFPVYDLVWMKRGDDESPKYDLPVFPSNMTYSISDWTWFTSPKGRNVMENTLLMSMTGFTFLLRGRVFISDRLHGHIFGILLGMPHVLIDNKIHKLTNYRNTWTKGLDNVLLASNATDALRKAMWLLKAHDNNIPQVVPYMNSVP